MDDDRHALTILLPLKDRPSFTCRWMDYANRVRLPYRVLVADGGAGDEVGRILADRQRFPHVDYEYVRYPPDSTYADFYAKVAEALSRIQTPLVALSDNDDFFVVPGLREAVAFLRTHDDYSACGGQCAQFWIVPDDDAPEGRAEYGRAVRWKCTLDAQSLTASTAAERLHQQPLGSMYPSFYHVQRTAALREQFGAVCAANPADLFMLEYFLSFLSVIAGKTRQLRSLYFARQANSPGGSGAAHIDRCGDWLGRMLVPSWSADFAGFLDVTSRALAAGDGIMIEEARRCVIAAYRRLVAPSLLESVLADGRVRKAAWAGMRGAGSRPARPGRGDSREAVAGIHAFLTQPTA